MTEQKSCMCAQATKKVSELALQIKGMRGFVHVSTAYVNSNLPRGSHIEERIYPLRRKDGRRLEHAKLALQLAALPPTKAEATVSPIPPCLITSYRGADPFRVFCTTLIAELDHGMPEGDYAKAETTGSAPYVALSSFQFAAAPVVLAIVVQLLLLRTAWFAAFPAVD